MIEDELRHTHTHTHTHIYSNKKGIYVYMWLAKKFIQVFYLLEIAEQTSCPAQNTPHLKRWAYLLKWYHIKIKNVDRCV